jgi:glyoxylase I family protein
MKKAGTMNHVRFTVTDIARSRRFYDPLLRFMGYALTEEDEQRLAWSAPSPVGNRQWLIVSVASHEARHREHDMFAPGLHHFAFNADSRAEVDAFHDLLLANDVEVLDPPAEYGYEPGYYAVFFRDPDRLKLEFVYVPAA